MSGHGARDLPRTPGWVHWALRHLLSEREVQTVYDELAELHAVWTERAGRNEADRRYVRQLRWYPLQLVADRTRAATVGRRRLVSIDALAAQLRYMLRRLRRAPLFTAVAVLTLAVGIGSNAAIFAVVNGVLLEPLPFKDPRRLVDISYTAPGLGFDHLPQSPALHYTAEAHNHSFTAVGMWNEATSSVTGLQEPEQVPSMVVTPGTLALLGITPVLGRTFTAGDGTYGKPGTVMLSYAYWERRFGGERGVLGRTLKVAGESRQIIGVLPKGFDFLGHHPDICMPFQFDRAKLFVGDFRYQGVARLRPGVTIAEADSDVARMIPLAEQRYPGGVSISMLNHARFAPAIHPLKQDVVGDTGKVLWVLLGAVGLILLIACANVANLFLVRAEGLQRDAAIRMALGAGRGHIARELLGESLLLGLLGGVAGVGLAWAGLKLLVAIGPESLPRLHEITLDGRVLAFTLGLSLLSGVLFGLFPALRYAGPRLVPALKESGRGGGAGRERHRGRNALVVSQMALALVLLTGSGLMIRSFQALRHVNPGFYDPDRVLTFSVSLPEAEVNSANQVALDFRQMLDRVRATPGVTSAALTSSLPMDGNHVSDGLEAESRPTAPGQIPLVRRYKWISDGYPEAMGDPLVAGRSITRMDLEDRARVVLVTKNLARAEWGSAHAALGQRVRQFGTKKFPASAWFEVVGVVGNVRDDGVAQDPVATVYWPESVQSFYGDSAFLRRTMSFVVRSASADPAALLPAMRKVIWGVDSSLPLADVRTLASIEASSMAPASFTLVMLGLAAAVALFLGMVGIYGVISYVVSQRTREIGVRMALGAERREVVRMVLREALVLAGIGVALGLAAAAGLTRLMASLLYGVSPLDPLTFACVALALTGMALLASWLPARRAARVDLMRALGAQ